MKTIDNNSKVCYNTIIGVALRFFYCQTLHRGLQVSYYSLVSLGGWR